MAVQNGTHTKASGNPQSEYKSPATVKPDGAMSGMKWFWGILKRLNYS